MIHQIDGLSRYSSNRKSSSTASINCYHSTKKVSTPPFEPRRTNELTFSVSVGIDDLLIFVRLYNSQYESLLYAGHFLVSQQQSFRRPHTPPCISSNANLCLSFAEKCLNDIAFQMKIVITPSTTFIVHQAVPTHNQTHQYELVKASSYDLSLSQVLDPCLSGASIVVQIIDINQTTDDYPLTTIEDYFR